MKSKRILALLLAIMVLASLALTACGNNATEEEEIVEEEVVTGGETTEEETEEVEEEFTRFDEIENLFVWGIEGRDYELTEDGEAFRLEGLSYQSIEFFYGNQFNAYPAKGLLPLTRDLQWENNEAGEMSRYFGLNIDTEAIANEMVAVQAVIDQYVPQMGSGVVDPTTLWDDYVKDLEAAGLQAVLDHYQVAVDEFLANK